MTKWAILFLFLAAPGFAAPPPGANPAFHEWFMKQRSTGGVGCCSEADGHILEDSEWRIVGTQYEILVHGKWFLVPKLAMRDTDGGPNPTGHAVAWYIELTDDVIIHCFAQGFEG